MRKGFNKDVRLFNVKGIQMLGNFQNGSIIGLNEDGINYVNDEIHFQNSQSNLDLKKLENELKDLGYYTDQSNLKTIDAAYLHVTDRCNLDCIGCYSYMEKRNINLDLSLEDNYYILDNLRDVHLTKLVISGGEPFLRDDLDLICKYAKEKSKIQYVTAITNGTLKIENYLPVLPYLDELSISVDGYNESTHFIREKGIMPTVIDKICQLQEFIPINLIFTLHKKNMKYMNEYNDLAKELNVKYSYSIFTADPSEPLFQDFLFTNEDLHNIGKNLMKLNNEITFQDMPFDCLNLFCREKCEVGNKLISIGANGDVFPCHMLHKQELVLGNILRKNESLREIVFSYKNPFRQLSSSEINECNACQFRELCGGGCRGRSYLYHENFYEKDAYCLFIYEYYDNVTEMLKKTIL